MRRATFLASVEADLVDIFTALAEASGSLSVARGYVRRLRDHCHHLAGLPGQMGRARPELMEANRSATFGNYVNLIFKPSPGFQVRPPGPAGS